MIRLLETRARMLAAAAKVSLATLFFAVLCALVLAGAASGQTSGQTYPSRPVTIVVPAAPGTATDPLARILAKQLESRLKQPFVVVNKVGAGGYIGADFVARSAPDGYTLLFTPDTALSSYVFSKEQRDLWQELTLLRLIGTQPLALLASTSLRASNLREFVAAVKASPGKYNYGYVVNTTVQLETERFLRGSGLEMVGVSYSSTAPAVQALMAGDIQFVLTSLSTMRPVIDAGRGVALAVTSPQRFSLLPAVPATSESGVEMNFANRAGIYGPAKLPPAIVDLLRREVAAIMETSEMKTSLQQLTLEPVPGSVDEQWKLLLAQAKAFEDTAKAMGIQRE